MGKVNKVKITIDGTEIEAEEGATILETAWKAGIYIPSLCSHPDLPFKKVKPLEKIYVNGKPVQGNKDLFRKEFEGCQLCLIKIEGTNEILKACETTVREGLKVITGSDDIKELRRRNLAKIMADHPHACLVCEQREGCTREPCSSNVPVEERCCELFGNCELQRVVEYVGLHEETPRYVPKNLPKVENEPLIVRDYNLCIACMRCVKACRELKGVEALGFTYDGDKPVVGTVAPTLKESGCRFCGACVEVCPTGALKDKGLKMGEREKQLVPCKNTCPINLEVPLYINSILNGNPGEAAALIREKTPFPMVLGYVCHHPCEEECRRSQVNEPIAICDLKLFASVNASNGWKEKIRKKQPTGKKVAVIGSGPAGLTAAYYLSLLGHEVKVFEKDSEPGGMLTQAIPRYRVPVEVVRKEIEEIREIGVKIETNVEIGRDITLNDLKKQFDAVFIAAGAQKSKQLNILGSDLKPVYLGLDFLKSINRGEKPELGREVVVIGGGNVAIDVARTARRLGAKVKLVCLESREEMPAHPWEIEEAVEEGVEIHPSWGPKKINGENGRVKSINLIYCTSVFDKEGRFNPKFDENKKMQLNCDTVIIAIGQNPDTALLKDSNLKLKNGGWIEADNETLQTSMPGVFAGGDIVIGPSSVVEAISQGRKAASSIDKYLGGDGEIDLLLVERSKREQWIGKLEGFGFLERVNPGKIPVKERLKGFNVVKKIYSEEEAKREAERCLKCDLRLYISKVMSPPEKWIELTQENVNKVPETPGVYTLLDEQKNIIYISGAMNLRQELSSQLETSEAKYFTFEENEMYTMRESELLQQYIKQHGKMPKMNEELEELF